MGTTRKWYVAIPTFVLKLIGYGIGGIVTAALILWALTMALGLLLYAVYGSIVTYYSLTVATVPLDRPVVRNSVIGTLILLALLFRAWKDASKLTYGLMEFLSGVGITWITFASKMGGTSTTPVLDRLPFVVASLFLIKKGVDTMAEALDEPEQKPTRPTATPAVPTSSTAFPTPPTAPQTPPPVLSAE